MQPLSNPDSYSQQQTESSDSVTPTSISLHHQNQDSSPDSVITSTTSSEYTSPSINVSNSQIIVEIESFNNDCHSSSNSSTTNMIPNVEESISADLDSFVSSSNSIDDDVDQSSFPNCDADTSSPSLPSLYNDLVMSCSFATSSTNLIQSAPQSTALHPTASESKNITMHRYYQKSSTITGPRPHEALNLFGNCHNSTNSNNLEMSWKASASKSTFSASSFSAPPTFNDLICQSFINPEMNDTILDSLDGSSGSDLDSDDSNSGSSGGKILSEKNKQRLPLEDFMRKIVFQINSTSDKVWSNLLLDFTKSFAEYQVPYNGFASNDYDLLLDILNIAMKNLESTQSDRRIFASRLLLNINELLNAELIRVKVMPVLKRVLNELLLLCSTENGSQAQANSIEPRDESSVVLRFNLCFVLAHFAQRLGFCYFVSHIFPFFEQMASNLIPSNDSDHRSSIAINFALLDSHIFLLSTVLHYNEVLSKKCSPNPTPTREHEAQDHRDVDTEMVLAIEEGLSDNEGSNSNHSTASTATTSSSDQHRHMSTKEVFDFISDRFIPLLKQLFQSLLDSILYYRSMCLPLNQEALDCFVQWKDQNRSTNESIIQTLYSHYQNFIFFALLLRDYLKKACYNDLDEDQTEEQETEIALMVEVMQTKFTELDAWYRNYYARLVQFLYSPMPERNVFNTQPSMNFAQFSQMNSQIQTQVQVEQHEFSQEIDCDDDDDDSDKRNSGLNDTFISDEDVKSSENEDKSSAATSTLVDNCMLTKITISNETATDEKLSSTSNNSTEETQTPSSTTSSSFIGKFQLTESKVNNQQSSLLSQSTTTSNATFFNVARMSSLRDSQHHQQQNHFPSSEIFGFFEFKTITCKAALINSVPILFDLYYITKSTSEIAANSVVSKLDRNLNSDSSNISQSPSSQSRCVDSSVINQFVESINAIVFDHSPEIVNKMTNVFHKLICRLPNSIRFYSFLVNLLQSQNVQVLANVANKFSDMFGAMIRQQRSSPTGQDMLFTSGPNQACDPAYIQTAVELILNAFLRSEAFLSTKPNWRLYIQYLEVLLDISRMISAQITKKLIVPRLLLRFSSTRHIPSRQAVIRCLLIIYLEQFAQHDFISFSRNAQLPGTSTTVSAISNYAKLDFDLFEWFDLNLRTASKYQQRQIFIDIYALFLRLVFTSQISSVSSGSVREHFLNLRNDSSEQNLYLVDLTMISPKMHSVEFDKFAPILLSECDRLRLVASIGARYELLDKLTSLAIEDRVSTIRASAATVLHSMIWTMKSCVIKTHLEHADCTAARILTGYLTVELMERLFERVHQDRDRLVVGQLKRCFKLVDSSRQDLNLSQPTRIQESLSTDEFITPVELQTPSPELEEVLDEVYVLMDDLLSVLVQTIELHPEELIVESDEEHAMFVDEPVIFAEEAVEEVDVPMAEVIEDEPFESLEIGLPEVESLDASFLETSLTTLTISTTTTTMTDSSEQTSSPPKTVSPRRGIIVISSTNAPEMITSPKVSSTETSGKANSRKKSKKSPPSSANGKSKSGNSLPKPKSPSGVTSNASSKQSNSNKRNLHSSSMIPLSLIASNSNNTRAVSPQPYTLSTPNSRAQQSRYTLTPHPNFSNKTLGSKPNLSASNGPTSSLLRASSSSNIKSHKPVRNLNSSYELKPINPNYYHHQIPVRGLVPAGSASQPPKAALLPTPPTPPFNHSLGQSSSSKLPVMFKSGNAQSQPLPQHLAPSYSQMQIPTYPQPSIVVTSSSTNEQPPTMIVHSSSPGPQYFVASHLAQPHFQNSSMHFAHSAHIHHNHHIQSSHAQHQLQPMPPGPTPPMGTPVPPNHYAKSIPKNRSKSATNVNNIQRQPASSNNNNRTVKNNLNSSNFVNNNNNNTGNGPTVNKTLNYRNQKNTRKQMNSNGAYSNDSPQMGSIKILTSPRMKELDKVEGDELEEEEEEVLANSLDLDHGLMSLIPADDNANCCIGSESIDTSLLAESNEIESPLTTNQTCS